MLCDDMITNTYFRNVIFVFPLHQIMKLQYEREIHQIMKL